MDIIKSKLEFMKIEGSLTCLHCFMGIDKKANQEILEKEVHSQLGDQIAVPKEKKP